MRPPLAAVALVLAASLLAGCRERPAAPLVRVPAGENLGAMTAAFGDVWVNDFGREELTRIDGGSGQVVARLPLGRRISIAAHGRFLWALRWGGRFFRTPSGPLFRIDPATNRVTRRIDLGDEVVFGVLAGAHGVWVWGPRRVRRLEPYSGAVVTAFDVGDEFGEITGAVLGEDGLLATTADGHLVHLGADGTRLGARVPQLERAELLAVEGGVALAAAAGRLVAVDAGTGRPRWRRALGFRISTLLARGGVLLVHGAAFGDPGDRLWAIDTATGRVLATATVPSFGTTSMAHARGALWFGTSAGEMIAIPPLMARMFLRRARQAS